MGFLTLTDDAILYVAETLHEEPLFGLLAVAALHGCHSRLRALLRALVAEQPAIRDRSCDVTYTWNVPRFSRFETMPADTKIYSPEFSTAFGHAFRFLLFPNGNRVQTLSVYVEVPLAVDAYYVSAWWSRRVRFTIRVAHPEDAHSDITSDEVAVTFSKGTRDWGFRHLIDLWDVPEMLSQDVLCLSACLTVEPPRLDFLAMTSLWAYREADDRALRSLMPSMLRDLKTAFASTDVKYTWTLCPTCGAGLTPPPCADNADELATMRMQCATAGCAGCPVAFSHLLLRLFVEERSCARLQRTWREWPWPLGDLAVLRPEHIEHVRYLSPEMMLRLKSDRLRDAAARQFSLNLDGVL